MSQIVSYCTQKIIDVRFRDLLRTSRRVTTHHFLLGNYLKLLFRLCGGPCGWLKVLHLVSCLCLMCRVLSLFRICLRLLVIIRKSGRGGSARLQRALVPITCLLLSFLRSSLEVSLLDVKIIGCRGVTRCTTTHI